MGFFRAVLAKLGFIKLKAGIIILGLTNSGKSTIVARLSNEPIEEVAATVGFSIEQIKMQGIKVTIMDMSGQHKYKDCWSHYYGDANGVIYVMDNADQDRWPEANLLLQDILATEALKACPLLIFCNKTDLPLSAATHEVAAALKLPAAKSRTFQLQPCSAIRNEGIQDGLKWLLTHMKAS